MFALFFTTKRRGVRIASYYLQSILYVLLTDYFFLKGKEKEDVKLGGMRKVM